MDLGDQWAGGVHGPQAPLRGVAFDALRDPVGAEHGDGSRRDLVDFLHEARSLALQVLDHPLVVNDLVPDIDGHPVEGEGPLDGLDGALHPGTESTGLSQQDAQSPLFRFAGNSHESSHALGLR